MKQLLQYLINYVYIKISKIFCVFEIWMTEHSSWTTYCLFKLLLQKKAMASLLVDRKTPEIGPDIHQLKVTLLQ